MKGCPMNRQTPSQPAALVLWLTLLPFPAALLAGAAPGLLRAVSIALLAVGSAQATENWPELPLPPKADVQWVAQSMRVNGIPTRVLQFQSRANRAEIVEYYRAHWTGGYPLKPSVQVVHFYQPHFQKAGGHQRQLNDIPPTEHAEGGTLMVFAQGEAEMQMTAIRGANGKGSWLIANRVTKDTGP